MKLPEQYTWLAKEGAPKILVQALKSYGVAEGKGNLDNKIIMDWAKFLRMPYYPNDALAWCGLFIAYVVKKAGYEPVQSPLWASNWSFFGNRVDEPMLGDIIVFTRPQGGHVGIYVGEDNTCYHILGGNQSDAVTITRILKSRAKAFRRPRFAIGQPANVRKIFLKATGEISKNEK